VIQARCLFKWNIGISKLLYLWHGW